MSRRVWSVVGLVLALLTGATALWTVAEWTRRIVFSAAPSAEDADMSAGTDERVELVRRSWASIVGWLEMRAPASAAALLGPADRAKLAAAQRATGRVWPEQLVAWLRMNDGGGRSSDSEILPLGFLPVGVDWIVENWRVNVDVSDEVWGRGEVAVGEAQPAGSKAGPFLRSWIPFGDNTGGDALFVDLRPGPLSGLVAEFEHENGGFTRPALWPDIAAMLESVAAGLRTGRWVHPNDPDYDQVPTVQNGRLRWEDGPATLRKRAEPPPVLSREQLRVEVELRSTWTDERIMAQLGISAEELADLRAETERFVEEQRRARD